MGGYGALSQPERFAAAASLSGALDAAEIARRRDDHIRTVRQSAFGPADKISGDSSDLFALARKLVRSCAKPPVPYACCGTDDHLLPGNRLFVEHAKKLGLPLAYEENQGLGVFVSFSALAAIAGRPARPDREAWHLKAPAPRSHQGAHRRSSPQYPHHSDSPAVCPAPDRRWHGSIPS